MKFQVVLTVIFAIAMCAESSDNKYIEGSYIVMLKEGSTEAAFNDVIKKIEEHTSSTREEMKIESDNSITPMIFGKFSEETAKMVSEIETVELVEKDQIVTIARSYDDPDEPIQDYGFSVPNRPNLDIIDNVNCTDGTYNPGSTGTGADIYILDTGIDYDHEDFKYLDGRNGSRAKYGGFDVIDNENGETREGRDCQGHGTHCAGIAAGLYSGVAKDANLFSIRVLSCSGGGTTTGLIRGMRAVRRRHIANMDNPGFKGSVISMSLGGGYSESLNKVVNNVIRTIDITIVTASGNEKAWACDRSPGSAGSNINVGAHDYDVETCKKPMAYFSNFGTCVDVLAPGVQILSSKMNDVNGYTRLSGTSMACPHVAGTAALMKSEKMSLTSEQVKQNIIRMGVDDIDRSVSPLYIQCSSLSPRLYVTSKLWET